ncbi:hypothetical protein ASPBRDRAFT_547096 [Aspergillus brasiliensis CBS 101740]|uniref:Uncharacterized protein n=1 Tax=Aspergillus brasiliensis (strain CBS 101740 / IMI 381727 / IBT 21946) TaxID=767769 RepID=A0A1L9ULQ4_ASPBC|nr:hypothetical protein ASPBRDRAFT_547096 [Aspergillus brasiliensis CBS 101740]
MRMRMWERIGDVSFWMEEVRWDGLMDGSIQFRARWNADDGGLLIGWWDCIAVGTVDYGFTV